MAGVDASIPLSGNKPGDAFSTIGSFLDVANKAQVLGTGRIQQQRQGVALQQEQGALDARRSISQVMSDPNLRDPSTGLVDLNKLWPALQQADPNGYLRDDVFNKAAGVNTDLMNVRSVGMKLGNQAQEYVAQRLGALSLEPNVTKDQVNSTLDDIEKVAPGAKPITDIVRKNVNALDVPASVAPVLARFKNFGFPLASQAPQTALVDTGPNVQPVQTNPQAGAVGPTGQPISKAPPPTSVEELVTDANGNHYTKHTNPDGSIVIQPVRTAGAGGGPGAPAPQTPPMMTLPPGESPQTKAMLEQERQAALQTLSGAPVMHTTNRGVLEEIDKTTTGTLGPRIAQVMSAAGVSLPKGWGGASSEERASAYDLVGKYLERNAITAAQSMGPHTNAGLESQIKAQGSVSYNPTAIKTITKLNDALVTGSEHYQPGLEKAITTSPDQIFAKRAYDQAWAQNFDPRVMMLYNAASSGDKSEVDRLKQSWGGPQSTLAKEILRKARNLDSLSTTGHLPQ